MRVLPTALAGLVLVSTACAPPPPVEPAPDAPDVLLRLDDIGMNHSLNMAMQEVIDAGIPFSTSMLFVGPWYQEAVEILKEHPEVSVGVHLALNSEWKDYRWGPVLGGGVPSLVDSVGYFHHSVDGFLSSGYDLGEVERELSAQVERALRSGLNIDYLDFHMGTAAATPELRAIVERIAKEHGLGISYYFGEASNDLWGDPIDRKRPRLMEIMSNLEPDRPNLVVLHVAELTPAMDALIDTNAPEQNVAGGGPGVSRHRHAELRALLSPEFARWRRAGSARLITYRELIAREGLDGMHVPDLGTD
jgi:hypothetical protein